MTRGFHPPAHERGAALLSVLILVGILGALAAVVFDRLRLATTLASNTAGIEAARNVAAVAETLVAVRTGDLVSTSPGRTTLVGGWHDKPTVLPLPIGSAEVRIRDGGNCFNLNSLVEGSTLERASRPAAIDQLARLLIVLDVPDALARRIAAASADWIDSDGTANPAGAEDSVYARNSPAYRTANTLMAEPSEWRAVAGVTPVLYARVRPWLCALPIAELSPINVNTLSADQAPLLAMLFPGSLSLATARQVIAARPAAGWATPAEFWNTPLLRSMTPTAAAIQQPKVRTSWFAVAMHVVVGDGDLYETALFDARETPVRISSRRWTIDE